MRATSGCTAAAGSTRGADVGQFARRSVGEQFAADAAAGVGSAAKRMLGFLSHRAYMRGARHKDGLTAAAGDFGPDPRRCSGPSVRYCSVRRQASVVFCARADARVRASAGAGTAREQRREQNASPGIRRRRGGPPESGAHQIAGLLGAFAPHHRDAVLRRQRQPARAAIDRARPAGQHDKQYDAEPSVDPGAGEHRCGRGQRSEWTTGAAAAGRPPNAGPEVAARNAAAHAPIARAATRGWRRTTRCGRAGVDGTPTRPNRPAVRRSPARHDGGLPQRHVGRGRIGSPRGGCDGAPRGEHGRGHWHHQPRRAPVVSASRRPPGSPRWRRRAGDSVTSATGLRSAA